MLWVLRAFRVLCRPVGPPVMFRVVPPLPFGVVRGCGPPLLCRGWAGSVVVEGVVCVVPWPGMRGAGWGVRPKVVNAVRCGRG